MLLCSARGLPSRGSLRQTSLLVVIALASCDGKSKHTNIPAHDASPDVDGSMSSSESDAGKQQRDDAGPLDASTDAGRDAAVSSDAGSDAGAVELGAWGYDEPYRPQFHFSAPMGWTNDANGMWFLDGEYHVAYQYDPLTLDSGGNKWWGHAVSDDMLHWRNLPPMLAPGQVAPGAVWSGSTVVDSNNASGLATGNAPVLLTFYTATGYGTALAYSNDQGKTWQGYANNPLAIGTSDNGKTRDPHVFYHATSNRWVCALWEDGKGISFYTSDNLRDWTYRSSVNFGFECPDIFELPVDGDMGHTKWLLNDASSHYLLGNFDGETFTPDGAVVGRMDQSDQYYAGQSFFRGTFPGTRVVSMAWVRGDQNTTAPFNQALTFPTEVTLKTFPSGVRAVRAPIAEISQLHADTQHLTNLSAQSGQNIVPTLGGESFDLTFTVDLTHSTAKSLTMDFPAANFALDLANHGAFGGTFSAIDGKVEVRILRDWGLFEVFINGGELSYTQAATMTPFSGTLSLLGDGTLTIPVLDFHTVKRAWPGKAAADSKIIDDRTAPFHYQGSWFTADEDRYFANGCSVATSQGASVELSFKGTRVEWYGLKNVDLGEIDVYLDNKLVATVDAYDAVRQNAKLFATSGLVYGNHSLRMVVTGNKNPSSSGIALVHDYVIVYRDE